MKIKNFKNRRVLITGNTGFKGSWMSLFLAELGAKIYGLSLAEPQGGHQNVISGKVIAKQFHVDVRDFQELNACIEEVNPDYIFHLAAKAITLESFEKPLESIETNVMGTSNLLESVRQRDKPCKVIVVTSDKCYENKNWVWGYRETDTLAGSDPYSASKSMVELVCRTYYKSFFEGTDKIKLATCRAGNVIGGGDRSNYRIVPDCIRAWMKEETLTIRNPDSVRPWNYVLDTIWGYILTAEALDKPEVNGQAFNFGPHREDEITVKELVEGLWTNWSNKDFAPYVVKRDELSEEREHKILTLSSDKAYRILRWKPLVRIQNALSETSRWYIQHEQQKLDVYAYSRQMVKAFIKQVSL